MGFRLHLHNNRDRLRDAPRRDNSLKEDNSISDSNSYRHKPPDDEAKRLENKKKFRDNVQLKVYADNRCTIKKTMVLRAKEMTFASMSPEVKVPQNHYANPD